MLAASDAEERLELSNRGRDLADELGGTSGASRLVAVSPRHYPNVVLPRRLTHTAAASASPLSRVVILDAEAET